MQRSRRRSIIVGYALAIAVTVIAGTIEWLNVRAGGVLPSREYRNGDAAQGPVKWRTAMWTSEDGWRRVRGPKESGSPANRPLTPSEQHQMENETAQARANNRLLSVVSSAGLMQYLLVPALLVTAARLLWHRSWGHGTVLAAVSIGAGCIMFYRQYFQSLGW